MRGEKTREQRREGVHEEHEKRWKRIDYKTKNRNQNRRDTHPTIAVAEAVWLSTGCRSNHRERQVTVLVQPITALLRDLIPESLGEFDAQRLLLLFIHNRSRFNSLWKPLQREMVRKLLESISDVRRTTFRLTFDNIVLLGY